ncbi:hypothetical protein KSP39_PZI023562 [Platanthera zijinensis]|uniref:Uncharacterized protein n=1 Tax=Platanthera zijinensis TaxID=2320716 RepID=A0AAP0ASI2_9ASPA
MARLLRTVHICACSCHSFHRYLREGDIFQMNKVISRYSSEAFLVNSSEYYSWFLWHCCSSCYYPCKCEG